MTIWLPEAVYDALEAGAGSAGVETGAVAREAVVRAHGGVLADVSAGRVKLRRRSGGVPVPLPDRKPSVGSPAPVVASASPADLPLAAGSSAPRDPGVDRAVAFRRAQLRARS